jgi:hypothetical protein
MMQWFVKPGVTPDTLGLIPHFLDEDDQRPAKKQFNAKYISGWLPMKGFRLRNDGALCYPGDPPLEPLAETRLRDETIRVYQFAWVCIAQPDGSFEVARLD